MKKNPLKTHNHFRSEDSRGSMRGRKNCLKNKFERTPSYSTTVKMKS